MNQKKYVLMPDKIGAKNLAKVIAFHQWLGSGHLRWTYDIEASYPINRIDGLNPELDVERIFLPHDFMDGIYNRTCIEFFAREPQKESYVEFNFSPDGKWAVFSFACYRTKTADLKSDFAASFKIISKNEFSWSWIVDLNMNTFFDNCEKLELYPTAILSFQENLTKTYFSEIVHTQDRPDFHAYFLGKAR